MFPNRLFSFLNILLCTMHLLSSNGLRNFEIRFTNINCSAPDSALVEYLKCEIVELGKRQGNILNVRFELRHNINKFTVDFRGYKINLGKNIQLVQVRLDGCQLQNSNTKIPMLNAVLKKLMQSGNYPSKCPLLAHVNYTSERFALNPDHFPPQMPDMKFLVKFYTYTAQNKPFIKVTIESEILRRI